MSSTTIIMPPAGPSRDHPVGNCRVDRSGKAGFSGSHRAGGVGTKVGHLLDQVGGTDRTAALREYVIGVARQTVPLLPGAADSGAMRDSRWKVLANAEVEAEL